MDGVEVVDGVGHEGVASIGIDDACGRASQIDSGAGGDGGASGRMRASHR